MPQESPLQPSHCRHRGPLKSPVILLTRAFPGVHTSHPDKESDERSKELARTATWARAASQAPYRPSCPAAPSAILSAVFLSPSISSCGRSVEKRRGEGRRREENERGEERRGE